MSGIRDVLVTAYRHDDNVSTQVGGKYMTPPLSSNTSAISAEPSDRISCKQSGQLKFNIVRDTNCNDIL